MAFLLFDIGGTKMRFGVSEDGKTIAKHSVFPTPSTFEGGLLQLKNVIELQGLQGKIEVAAGGIAGPLDRQKTQLLNAPNLPLWVGKSIKNEFQNVLGVPVVLENDTALVGLGEATVGAGVGKRIVAYLGIGTGVGGVRIVDGKIDENSYGFEPGHQIIDFSSKFSDGCGALGHLEGYVSGRAIEDHYGKSASDIEDPHFFDEIAKMLSYGLNNTIVYWSPEIIVLGGSIMQFISLERVRSHLQEVCTLFPALPEIVSAQLGDLGGLHGALVYLSQTRKAT